MCCCMSVVEHIFPRRDEAFRPGTLWCIHTGSYPSPQHRRIRQYGNIDASKYTRGEAKDRDRRILCRLPLLRTKAAQWRSFGHGVPSRPAVALFFAVQTVERLAVHATGRVRAGSQKVLSCRCGTGFLPGSRAAFGASCIRLELLL